MDSGPSLSNRLVENGLQCTLTSFSVVDNNLNIHIKLGTDKANPSQNLIKLLRCRQLKKVGVIGKIFERVILDNCLKCKNKVKNKGNRISLELDISDADSKCVECVKEQSEETVNNIQPQVEVIKHNTKTSEERNKKERKSFGSIQNSEGDSQSGDGDSQSCEGDSQNGDGDRQSGKGDSQNEAPVDEKDLPQKVETKDFQNKSSKFKCPLCAEDFKSYSSMKRHTKVHGKKPFKCEICGKSFEGYSVFCRHKKIHENKCKICGKMYKRSVLLATHMLSHQKYVVKKFSCLLCDKTFTAADYLKKHMKRHAGHIKKIKENSEPGILKTREESEGISGSTCSELNSVSTDSECVTNVQDHTSSGPTDQDADVSSGDEAASANSKGRLLQCPLCKEEFSSYSAMSGHTHRDRNSIKCDICNKSFSSLLVYVRHKETHEHKCSVCGKLYRRAVLLETHMLSHQSDVVKPFSCLLCDKAFTAEDYLKKHMKRHASRLSLRNSKVDKHDLPATSTSNSVCSESNENTPVSASSESTSSPRKVSTRSESRSENKVVLTRLGSGSSPRKLSTCPESISEPKRILPSSDSSFKKRPAFERSGYDCPVCGKTQIARAYLRRHMEDHTEAERKAYNVSQNNTKSPRRRTHGQVEGHQKHKPESASNKSSRKKENTDNTDEETTVDENGDQTLTEGAKDSDLTHPETERPDSQKQSIRHTCKLCGEHFQSHYSLRKHMKRHGDKPFKCDICSQSFESDFKCCKHRKTHMCDFCEETFRDESLLAAHIANHQATCQVCSELLPLTSLNKHMGQHARCRRNKPAKSTRDAEQSQEDGTVHEESKSAMEKNENNADVEKKIFKRKKRKTHVEKEKQVFKCDVCNITLSNKKNLEKHCLHFHAVSVPKSTFLCHICGESFSCQANVDKHVESNCTYSEKKKQRCKVCNKLLSNSVTLEKHMLYHTGEKPYMCEVCGKCFLKKPGLKSHMYSHAGYKPHACQICGHKFRNVWHLKVHTKTHTGENLLQCPDCKDWFVNASYLNNQHRQKYCRGRESFVCDICNRKFKSQRDLLHHNEYHTGKRPFLCNECGKSFEQGHHLDDHYKRHFEQRNIKCETCGKLFKRKTELRKHQRLHIAHSSRLKRCILGQEMKPQQVPEEGIIIEQELDPATVIVAESEVELKEIKLEPEVHMETVETVNYLTAVPDVSGQSVAVTLPSSLTEGGQEIMVVLSNSVAETARNIRVTENGEILMVAMEPNANI